MYMCNPPWKSGQREFKYGSELEEYFVRNTSYIKKWYIRHAFIDIMKALRDVVLEKKMFDKDNPFIMVFDRELEDILNLKYCHIMEARDIVGKHLEPPGTIEWKSTGEEDYLKVPIWSDENCKYYQIYKQTLVDFDITASYRMTPELFQVLENHLQELKKEYPYKEITSALSKYIYTNRKTILYPKNTKIAIVKDDPLGKAFGVGIFARCQVTTLLRSQLIKTGEASQFKDS